ncbi:MAG: elongation factor P [Caldiserica bacterium]|jgi:elongation factor P|nr:elongation factor P [Caldisericota bacterium]MDH7562938.1 elongation factor P [Caldisericota bacterium]
MISSNDLRPGTTIEIDGEVWVVVQFQHVKPGKGSAFVRTKIKNVETGNVIEKTFRAGERLTRAFLDHKQMQFLYAVKDEYLFMDMDTYEQVSLKKEEIEDAALYLKEGMMIDVLYYKGKHIGVEPPVFVELEVVETEPSFKGDTAQGSSKPAKLETGAIVQVPFFVEVGDVIKIDTRTGEYVERVGK